MQLFYAPDILRHQYQLSPDEAKHCTQVLRHRTGDHIHLTDGKGGLYTAQITTIDAHRSQCHFRLVEQQPHYNTPTCRLLMAVAPTKNTARFEWFLEKATEIGVTDILPLLTHRTERAHLRTERLEKILVAAMKQCVTAYLPTLHPASSFAQLMQNQPLLADFPMRFIPYLNPQNTYLSDAYQRRTNAIVLIGPEGDFTDSEVTTALAQQFVPISLGKSRLRTETAAIVCCHAIQFMNHQS